MDVNRDELVAVSGLLSTYKVWQGNFRDGCRKSDTRTQYGNATIIFIFIYSFIVYK